MASGAGQGGGGTGLGVLLGMQAAGAILDYESYKQQMKILEAGRKVSDAAFKFNIEAVRTEAAQASLAEMTQLRQVLGTQIAMQAARGTSSGAGSAFAIQQDSIAAFRDDERARRMNLLAKEAQLRYSNMISGLNTLTSETQLGQQLTSRIIDKMPNKGAMDLASQVGMFA